MFDVKRLVPTLTASALALGMGALSASALDLSALTEAERTAFRAEVRSYLIENPEVLMEAIGVLEERQMTAHADQEKSFLTDNKANIYQSAGDWSTGPADADVTVVEFLDYRCGYCRKAYHEVEELVKADPKLRLVVKEFPILNEDSLASSQFAVAARKLGGDEVYKAAHDLLIELQGPANDAALSEIAEEIKLDFAAVKAEMASAETQAILDGNRALASALQINGTPTFIVNDSMVRGYVPLAAMQAHVEEQRKAAKAAQ